ncbi:MAG: ABC transporter substrate-binding protein [Treponema sp.]|jgi:ABC-type nitrate/sulfonate/bicarbonate transport system substrate-binding protein|nr:ABC transporter substrate-binding protein [Treponema sp.]
MKKKNARRFGMIFVIIVTFAAISVLGSCKKKEVAGALPVIKIGLIVEDAVRPALVVAAEKLGYYEEEGVDVQLISIDTVNSGLAAVATRKLDIFPFSTPISFLAKGSDHVVIGGVAVEGSSLVVSPQNKDVDFRDPAQWKGKKIVGNPNSVNTYQFLRIFEKEPGFDINSFEFVQFDNASLTLESIKKGTVDGGFLTTERVWMAEDAGCKEAFDLAEYLPYYICCRLTANINGVKENRDPYVAVLRALLRAEHDYKEETDKIVDAVTEYTQQKRENVVRYFATEKDFSSGQLVNFKNPVSPDPLFNKFEALNETNLAVGNYEWTAPFTLRDRVDITIYQDAIAELLKRFPDDRTYQKAYELFKENNSAY